MQLFQKIPVGILGATGMVGERYVELLANHPWFEVKYLAASSKSAGQKYSEAVSGRWHMQNQLPENIKDLIVEDAKNVDNARDRCGFVFSALEMDTKDEIKNLENQYASAGIPVVSNTSAHRSTPNVPMVIPEINPDHLELISSLREKNGWDRGLIVTKPNCSLQSYITPLFALMRAGFEIKKVMVTTMQAISGAGYPGVASLDVLDNVIPYIDGEEEKTEKEPLKIFGQIVNGEIVNANNIIISANCNRVPVLDGHLAVVSIGFGDRKPCKEEIIRIWRNFRGLPQELKLPSAPAQTIIYREEENRPQPRRDRDSERGMAVTVGRLRECPVLDYKFVGLSHNTIRGAAGGGILNAELLVARGYIRPVP